MANEYMKRCCSKCIFYSDEQDYGVRCNLYGDSLTKSYALEWITATDYHQSSFLREKHDEECKHYTNIYNIKNQIRKKFGINIERDEEE